MENPWEIDIRSAKDRILGEREDRLKNAMRRLPFGVPFLDRALGGIRPNGLLIIGASSGAGKTELVTTIARTNVEGKRRVHMFPLEAEPREIERRILYKLIAQQFFKDKNHPIIPISYRDWYDGLLDEDLIQYEAEANRIFDEKFASLYTAYRKQDFTVDHLARAIDQIKAETDLIIIDHLNYFDYDESQSENQAVTRIMKKIRDIVLIHGIPIVLVAHLRKPDRRSKLIMPELEDFIGTSNVYKIPTEAVLISPAPMPEQVSPIRFPTYMRVGKFRIEGGITRFIARCTFNAEKNEYEPEYRLGYYQSDEFKPIDDPRFLPRWARVK